ncbi:putative bifunctional diguanylate cyclase/phosphodiesterase [Roseibium sp.]|uniref:putative bifunctional diguanylate cyclase/phosphodiesterase n=1 Tax=Roseibium sp. TaxID=1936156 RepID=UPI003B510C67
MRDTEVKRSGYHFLDTVESRLDHIAAQWSDDGARIERPLKAVFIGFLALIVCILTLQNIVTEVARLQVPFDRVQSASKKLVNQEQQRNAQALATLTDRLTSDDNLTSAMVKNDPASVALYAERAFDTFNGKEGPYRLAVYGSDHSVLYRKGPTAAALKISSDMTGDDDHASAPRVSNSLEYDQTGTIVVRSTEPLVHEGRLLGYLDLSSSIETHLMHLSSAVNGKILKTGGPVTAASTAGSNQQNAQAASAAVPLLFKEDDTVLMTEGLALPLANAAPGSKIMLQRDVTAAANAFFKTTLVVLLVSLGFAILAWVVMQRLLARLQRRIGRTWSSLEEAVSSNTKELERSRAQLLEAQAIASIGSWECDLSTKEISASEEFFRITGISPTTASGNLLEQLIERVPATDLPRVKSVIHHALAQCQPFDLEHSILRADGSLARIHTKGRVFKGENGRSVRGIGTVHDITERFNTERQNTLMAKILETSLNEIYVLNADTYQVEYANACAITNLGYTLTELQNLTLWDINQEFSRSTIAEKLVPLAEGTEANITGEAQQRRKDGTDYPVDFQIQMVRDQGRNRIVAMANDISERVQRESETRDAKERAERLAYFDPLTKLSNRAGCQRDAGKRFAKTKKPAFLIHVDMDNFKRVNDTLGHLAGDYCLAETGRRLREVSRGLGTPYRWGGDEFVILANSSDSDPNELCERARRLMRAPMEFNGTTFWPTVSMGIALCPDHGTNFETLLVNADLALYRSKHSGKDRFTFYSSDLQSVNDKEAELERELHMAAQRDEFFLVFQPQVNMRTHKVVGVEALVRWQHPERGVVSPGEFLPVVEKTGFAAVLGEIVLDKAFAAAKSWQDAGLDFGRISVNVSPAHLSSGMLFDQFKTAMERHDLAPERITAEVLESVFLDDHKSGHLSTLKDLYEMGVHVELDDFGTGYASLTHVVDLPINGLKIDRSFTQQLLEDDRKEILINQLIHLARSLNISVVCEGVETEEQYDRLRMMGDFAVQGFLIAKPLRFEDATNWMSETAEDLYFVF